ncbi:FAD binding domain-containing protein [Propylenella binzhouense]|uniref:Xanthine dehydrogenase family protein subunit M n=1 Tax=Propylenella binzhouense TaxID=2555902 RepID=A0A964T4P7_9HYPH|nr:FAD binding domain-containing protein [Propylenella binzhouense]MYZ48461.1 xanthine dehydrogenase family protein subunit M [Propylenella binzhouense]
MKPAAFVYRAPASLPEALAQLREFGGDARVIAGGQTLVPAMSMRLARPAALIDLNGVAELAFLRAGADAIEIGAMTRQRTLERSAEIGRHARLFHLALPHVAHFQIRNRGTFGGSLCHNDPAAELPAVAAALSAEFVIAGASGDRTVGADGFFAGLLSTALEPDEILRAIRIPYLPGSCGFGFAEVARRHGDFALAGAAAVLRLGGDGTLDLARLVLFGVDDGPVRAHAAEAAMLGERPSDDLWSAAAAAAVAGISPVADLHASALYRREVAETLARRVLRQAAAELRDG